jgi:ATP synthase F1 complex assembly factor 2
VLDWFCERFGVDLRPSLTSFAAAGGTSADSLAACKDVMRKHLLSHGMSARQGVAFGVDALKSVVIAMAVFEKRLTVENAVALARLEVQVQVRNTCTTYPSEAEYNINREPNRMQQLASESGTFA